MMSARIAKTWASLMKLGPSDAMTEVRERARLRWMSSERRLEGPNKIQRRRSRRKAITNGDSRNQTVITRSSIMAHEVPESLIPRSRNRRQRPAGCRISIFRRYRERATIWTAAPDQVKQRPTPARSGPVAAHGHGGLPDAPRDKTDARSRARPQDPGRFGLSRSATASAATGGTARLPGLLPS